jgi:hypothetical protein
VGAGLMGLKKRAEEISRPSEDKQLMKIAAELIQYVWVLCKVSLQTAYEDSCRTHSVRVGFV